MYTSHHPYMPVYGNNSRKHQSGLKRSLPTLLILHLSMSCFLVPGISFSQAPDGTAKHGAVSFHGNICLNTVGYTVSGIPVRADLFTWVLSGNATFKVSNLEIPLTLIISDKQKSYSQSFNQFGISPHWKWITVHAGYRNITFSNYTLAGRTFLGGGIELNPSLFRFGFVYGRFNRSTGENLVYENDYQPQYKNTGFAVKLGVGNNNNFFDLILLRIKDDSNSVKQPDTGLVRTPVQNLVSGFNSRFTFFRQLVLETELAISLYTTNQGAPVIDDIEDDAFLKTINKFTLINQSSEYYTAGRASLQYKSNKFSCKLEYRRIDPNYRSLGAYFLNNDLENLTLSPAFGLFKGKVYIAGSIGLQRDNLRATKKATSVRTIGNVSVSLNPSPKFGIDANYGNYSISQKDGRFPLNDTTKVRQANQNFSVMPRVFLFNSTKSHMLMLVYNFANFLDRNKFTSDYTNFTSQTAQLSYILGLVPGRWSFNAGLTYVSSETYASSYSNIGIAAGVSKSLLDNKLSINWNNALTRSDNENERGWIFNSTASVVYQVTSHHNIRFNIYFTGNYNDPGSINPSFNEFKGDMTYVYTF